MRISRGADPRSNEAEPNLVFCDPAASAARSRPHGNRKVSLSSGAHLAGGRDLYILAWCSLWHDLVEVDEKFHASIAVAHGK